MRCLLLLLALWPVLARADERWNEYQVLMWQDRTPTQMRALPALGFTGAKLSASQGRVDEAGKAARQQAGLPYYLENLATDFYAPYHRYTPGKPVNWLFDGAKAAYRASDLTAAFARQPSLSDPAWQQQIGNRLARTVREQGAGRPLFYNLADEAGIGDVAAAWDFDIAPPSLALFQDWLRQQYGSVDVLNRQWGTSYSEWPQVAPELTDAAIRRQDQNFSAWSDFKAWMDVAFADAVRSGTVAVHDAEPGALAALEGAQVPGWGGYDYTLLAPAVDVMEIYDYGESLDLALAFNPSLLPLRTSFGRGPREVHEAWRSLLHGGRGMVVWDETDDVVAQDGTPGPRGREIAALIAAFRPVAATLRGMRPDPDPVAVLYSQASFRIQWLLDRRAGDHDWAARDAEREYDDNPVRGSRRVLLQRLAELAVQPRLVSGAGLSALLPAGVKVLFLPHAIALSDQEVAVIRTFRNAGGTVLADVQPGIFDGHGRRRMMPPLPDIARPEAVRPLGIGTNPTLLTALADLLRRAGAPPRVRLTGPDGMPATGVEGRWFTGKRGTLLALQAARPWSTPATIGLRLSGPGALSDARGGRAVNAGAVQMDGIEPTILLIR